MNREQFLKELRNRLKRLPPDDVNDALEYYEEYLDEAGPEKEAETISAWGTPAQVASQILADYVVKQGNGTPTAKKGLSTAWTVALAICASPVAVPLAAAAVCVMIALVVAVAAVILSIGACAAALAAGGVVCVIAGLSVTFQSFPTMLFFVGIGLLCAGAGIALFLFTVWLGKKGFFWIAKLFSKILPRRKKLCLRREKS
mgnify:FL=1|jgi:uncharacterized membrane protein